MFLAAEFGHLDCLKYCTKPAKAPWASDTASIAADNGHLHILEYLVERKYDEYDEKACQWAAENGHLDCLKYLHETAKAPWDGYAFKARKNKHPTYTSSQRLSGYQTLAIRKWRVTHTRIRIRIRVRIRLKTCNTTNRAAQNIDNNITFRDDV